MINHWYLSRHVRWLIFWYDLSSSDYSAFDIMSDRISSFSDLCKQTRYRNKWIYLICACLSVGLSVSSSLHFLIVSDSYSVHILNISYLTTKKKGRKNRLSVHRIVTNPPFLRMMNIPVIFCENVRVVKNDAQYALTEVDFCSM